MKKFKRLLLVLPVIAAMILASIPVSADYSASCFGGDNVGMNGKYEWSISIYNWSGEASGWYQNGTGDVNCYLNTWFFGTMSSTGYCSNSISGDSYYQIYSGGVNFYDN